MKPRRKEFPTCALCTNVEDLLVVGATRLCENCRTCPHGIVHFSTLPEHLCAACIRDLFTVPTFEGLRIGDLEEYVAWARDHGIPRDHLLAWAFEEETWLWQQPAWRWGDEQLPCEEVVKELLHPK